MKLLLSLPPNLVDSFRTASDRLLSDDIFASSDPEGLPLGSGGGTVWLLDQWIATDTATDTAPRIIIHAGGQSRRLPAYAATGKILTPIPVLRWDVGQQIDQDLLSLQLPLYTKILQQAPPQLHTLIASGDVCLRCDRQLPALPDDADVVCFGLWAEPTLASRHGVFLARHDAPETLDHMLQKPDTETLNRLSATHYYMMDIGLWILSDRAISRLRKKSIDPSGNYRFYDLYSQFGCALGAHPSAPDPELADLKVAILPLPEGEFYHFGTTRELISSTLALQNKVVDQRRFIQRKSRPNPAQFTQNCIRKIPLTSQNDCIWIENSYVTPGWSLTSHNVVTGIPDNDWTITLSDGVCLDVQPIGPSQWAVRPYGFDDPMRGMTDDPATLFLGCSLEQWLQERNLTLPEPASDIQSAPLFPLVDSVTDMGLLARFMTGEPDLQEGRSLWLRSQKISADDICRMANITRLIAQRRSLLKLNLPQLADNWAASVFYQLDLDDTANKFESFGLQLPSPLPDSAPIVDRMRNAAMRRDSSAASGLLSESILSTIDTSRAVPHSDIHSDQIVWARSPVRIDLAGGWTDTPPYSMLSGGNVVNAAIELNGQPPLQVFVKPAAQPHIVIHSIDLGASETITTFEQLSDFRHVGSPFSIPKAALALAGFLPAFSERRFNSLRTQLLDFGFGIEITLLSAVPAGSGLGTSSILAATVLGALNDFCSLAWDNNEICRRTLALEQMLTTGGGWQDQYGGVLQGVKLLQTEPGSDQRPLTSWLPDAIFTDPMLSPCHLLYYTGLTRTAKEILSQIVRRMMLNSKPTLLLLNEMRAHALDMARAIQQCDFTDYGRLIDCTWQQNQRLDSGTNPPAVSRIIDRIADLTLGLKLPGAGGGGFIYMVAKDPEAAARIRARLTEDAPNPRARFVDMTLSSTGLRVSRS